MSLSSPLCRIGRKKPIQHIIMSVSPKQFNKYVEPFVGSGDIYFELNLDSSIPVVINDLDTEIATAFKILKMTLYTTKSGKRSFVNVLKIKIILGILNMHL